MQEIFEEALKLKAKTVLTDQVFDFAVHMPRRKQRPLNPIEETFSDDSDARRVQLQEQEDFYTLASFHIYAPVTSIPRDPMTDALVNPRNFIDKAIFTRTDKPVYSKTMCIQNFESLNDDEDDLAVVKKWVPSAHEQKAHCTGAAQEITSPTYSQNIKHPRDSRQVKEQESRSSSNAAGGTNYSETSMSEEPPKKKRSKSIGPKTWAKLSRNQSTHEILHTPTAKSRSADQTV